MNTSIILDPLNELFSISNDELKFDKDNLDTFWNSKASLSDFRKNYSHEKNVIYSLASVEWSYQTQEVFLRLKDGIKNEEMDKFITHIGSDIQLLLKELGTDYIVQVPSSSQFLKTVYNRMSSQFNIPSASFLTLIKSPIGELKFNSRKAEADGLSRSEINELKSAIKWNINLQIKDDMEYLEAKRFPKDLLRYVSGFFKVSGDVSSLKGKSVLIVDDNLSSGTTMRDIVDMFSTQYECKASGLVIFKILS